MSIENNNKEFILWNNKLFKKKSIKAAMFQIAQYIYNRYMFYGKIINYYSKICINFFFFFKIIFFFDIEEKEKTNTQFLKYLYLCFFL